MLDIKISPPMNIAELPHQMAPDYKRVYANNASMALTFWDASVTFGETVLNNPLSEPHVEDRVTVSMSWEHVKAFYLAMGQLIDNYENAQGAKIRTPALLVPPTTDTQ